MIDSHPHKVEIPFCDINENIEFERFRINPLSNLLEPPVYCRISGSPTMTAGNFSLINGKAKSGKTFLLGAIVASMVTDSKQIEAIKGCIPEDKKIVLYFDTEQSTFHATRSIKRICSLINNTNPPNLIAYGLRPLTPAERLEAIEEVLSNTENLGAVAIDGVRDLLTRGINDEEEATTLTSKFLKWTSDYDIHLILLLHQNKTDFNARGHIGTEILNKAETTISVTKDTKTNIFIVSCEYSRDIAFDDFGFIIDDGVILPSIMPGQEQVKARKPQLIDDQEHIKILDNVYKSNEKLTGEELRDAIIYGFNNVFGQSVCRTFISHYLQNEWIAKEREGQKVFYVYKRAIF
jgi:AAA domain